MRTVPKVKPTHKAVKTYYAALEGYSDQSVEHEGALLSGFAHPLGGGGRGVGCTLIPELPLDGNGHEIRRDRIFPKDFSVSIAIAHPDGGLSTVSENQHLLSIVQDRFFDPVRQRLRQCISTESI